MSDIYINGKKIAVSQTDEELSLLIFLRERLDMTGTKNGCNIGVCGACNVIVDNGIKRACKTTVKSVLHKEVITIEGLQRPDGSLHPIQQAFVDAGAIQCGFCTPGMVMAAYGLLLRNAQPNREEIRKALIGNLCRCTGYQQIVDAVELAAEALAQMVKEGTSPSKKSDNSKNKNNAADNNCEAALFDREAEVS